MESLGTLGELEDQEDQEELEELEDESVKHGENAKGIQIPRNPIVVWTSISSIFQIFLCLANLIFCFLENLMQQEK